MAWRTGQLWAVLVVIVITAEMVPWVTAKDEEFPYPMLQRTNASVVSLNCRIPGRLFYEVSEFRAQRIEIQTERAVPVAHVISQRPYARNDTLHPEAEYTGGAEYGRWDTWYLNIVTPFSKRDTGVYQCLIVYTEGFSASVKRSETLRLSLDTTFLKKSNEKSNDTFAARNTVAHHVTVTWRPPDDTLSKATLYRTTLGCTAESTSETKAPLYTVFPQTVTRSPAVLLANNLTRYGLTNFTLSAYIGREQTQYQRGCRYSCEVSYPGCVGDKAKHCVCSVVGCSSDSLDMAKVNQEKQDICSDYFAAMVSLAVICGVVIVILVIIVVPYRYGRRYQQFCGQEQSSELMLSGNSELRVKVDAAIAALETEVNTKKGEIGELTQKHTEFNNKLVNMPERAEATVPDHTISDLVQAKDQMEARLKELERNFRETNQRTVNPMQDLTREATDIGKHVDKFAKDVDERRERIERADSLKQQNETILSDMNSWLENAQTCLLGQARSSIGMEESSLDDLTRRLVERANELPALLCRGHVLVAKAQSLGENISIYLGEEGQQNHQSLENTARELSDKLNETENNLQSKEHELNEQVHLKSLLRQLEDTKQKVGSIEEEGSRMKDEVRRKHEEVNTMGKCLQIMKQLKEISSQNVTLAKKAVERAKNLTKEANDAKWELRELLKRMNADGYHQRDEETDLNAELERLAERLELAGPELEHINHTLKQESDKLEVLERKTNQFSQNINGLTLSTRSINHRTQRLTQSTKEFKEKVAGSNSRRQRHSAQVDLTNLRGEIEDFKDEALKLQGELTTLSNKLQEDGLQTLIVWQNMGDACIELYTGEQERYKYVKQSDKAAPTLASDEAKLVDLKNRLHRSQQYKQKVDQD